MPPIQRHEETFTLAIERQYSGEHWRQLGKDPDDRFDNHRVRLKHVTVKTSPIDPLDPHKPEIYPSDPFDIPPISDSNDLPKADTPPTPEPLSDLSETGDLSDLAEPLNLPDLPDLEPVALDPIGHDSELAPSGNGITGTSEEAQIRTDDKPRDVEIMRLSELSPEERGGLLEETANRIRETAHSIAYDDATKTVAADKKYKTAGKIVGVAAVALAVAATGGIFLLLTGTIAVSAGTIISALTLIGATGAVTWGLHETKLEPSKRALDSAAFKAEKSRRVANKLEQQRGIDIADDCPPFVDVQDREALENLVAAEYLAQRREQEQQREHAQGLGLGVDPVDQTVATTGPEPQMTSGQQHLGADMAVNESGFYTPQTGPADRPDQHEPTAQWQPSLDGEPAIGEPTTGEVTTGEVIPPMSTSPSSSDSKIPPVPLDDTSPNAASKGVPPLRNPAGFVPDM